MPAARAPSAPEPDTLATPLRDRLLVLALLLLGSTASWLGQHALRQADARHAQERSQAAAQTVQIQVQQALTRTLEAARSAGLMVETHPQLQQRDFMHYAQQLTAQLPPITLFEWQPWVLHSERAAFEQAARAQGLEGFEIREPDPAGTGWRTAPAREHYLPVLYGWPAGIAPLGFDLAPDALRMGSKRAAAAQRRPVASTSFPIIRQSQAQAPVTGFAISTPVFEQGGGAPRLRGFMAAVVELPNLFEAVTQQAQRSQFVYWVFEGPSTEGPLRHQGGAAAGTLPARSGPAQALEQTLRVDVAGQPWTLLLQPSPAFLRGDASLRPLLALASGLLATALLALAVARGFAARRAAEQARRRLAEEERRLSNVIEGTRAATWEHDFETGSTHVNEHWEAICGYPPGAYQPATSYQWQQDCHPEDLERVKGELRRHLQGESALFDVEYRHRQQDGGWRWVQSRGKVLRRDAEGRATLMAGTLMDIDARKQAEFHLQELNSTLEARVAQRSSELAQAMESLRNSREALAEAQSRAALNAMVAGVTHELSSPMSNSLVCAQNLVERAGLFEQRLQGTPPLRRSELAEFVQLVRENADLAQRNLQRAGELMRKFRQVAADQASEQRRPFDLAEMVQELLATLSPTLQRQPHRVQANIPPGLRLESYPGPLGQVLINLINNALLHAFPPGQNGEVLLSAEAQGEQILLRVADNGRGMDAATLEQLFKPFFSTRIGQGGMGLGMPIVDRLVHKTLGGQIVVRSQPGQGTVFEISLPRVAPSTATE
ncbi:ATP-binding protein [Inhella proteolytica]|uniref:histidine kinase n=1 Tax=Inhella proteolytica TaxID=2795029 RepID=A0A931J845_9BURK|nr:ATP-binding protein [Inhella proteolytica]MBH9578532.1 CHASE domain-containing protein [Inhella proteolytica]